MAKRIAERDDVIPILAELFREYGFDAASLSLIGKRTGLGKGSLYNFFPGGKEEMANAVLDEIDDWFGTHIFRPLRESPDPRAAVLKMLVATEIYFRSGRRVCLVGALALAETRSLFRERINRYFAEWKAALSDALQRMDVDRVEAMARSEDILAQIQGGLVLARALDDPAVFARLIVAARARLPK